MSVSEPMEEGHSAARRRFLQVAGGFTMAAIVAPTGAWSAADDAEPWFRISLAQWSLNRSLFAGDIDHLDFAAVARTRFGIEAVEYVSQFFPDKANHEGFLKDMRTRADDHGVQSLLIMVDGEGALGDPDNKERMQAVRQHRKWVRAAAALGCHSIRVNAESHGDPNDQSSHAADGLRTLTEYADAHEVNVIVENHGGMSSNGAWLADVIQRVDHPRCGTLPDFGNFRIREGDWYDRYQGVREMMPFAKAVSAKSHAFDEAGDETGTDYMRMLKIVQDAGYRGWIGVEYEGSAHSEDEGIRLTRDLLRRCRDQLSEA